MGGRGEAGRPSLDPFAQADATTGLSAQFFDSGSSASQAAASEPVASSTMWPSGSRR